MSKNNSKKLYKKKFKSWNVNYQQDKIYFL